MEEQFRIGGTYRQRNGELVKVIGRAPYKGSNRWFYPGGEVLLTEGGGQRNLNGECCNLDGGPLSRFFITPGELHCVGGEWLPIAAPVVEEKKEEASSLIATPSKSPLEQLRELVEVQGRDGNWNFDSYMVGMFNGMELALSVMEGRDPQYRTLKPAAAPQALSTSHAPLPALSLSPDREGASHRLGGRFGTVR